MLLFAGEIQEETPEDFILKLDDKISDLQELRQYFAEEIGSVRYG